MIDIALQLQSQGWSYRRYLTVKLRFNFSELLRQSHISHTSLNLDLSILESSDPALLVLFVACVKSSPCNIARSQLFPATKIIMQIITLDILFGIATKEKMQQTTAHVSYLLFRFAKDIQIAPSV